MLNDEMYERIKRRAMQERADRDGKLPWFVFDGIVKDLTGEQIYAQADLDDRDKLSDLWHHDFGRLDV